MGRGRSESGGKAEEGPSRRYPRAHGDPGGVFREGEAQSRPGFEDARPPGFPSVEELKELNRGIHEDAGQPERFALDQPSPLHSCLDRAQAAYSQAPEGVIETAALLAHGIAQAQAFRDGNRRTAYFACLSFLNENGYGYLSPEGTSDHTLARYLNQVVENQATAKPAPGPAKFAALFSRRLQRRGEGR
jgi:prophage maintenance system killer protein